MRLVAQFMKRIRQFGFVRMALGEGREAEPDEGRILHLFRNRIELKKSFSSAQEEIQRLKDRVKQQEGATARVQELLHGLEARLAQPETAYQALVFYQLRELWTLGQSLVQQLVTELETQQIERERRSFFADFNRRQFDRRQGVETSCQGAEEAAMAVRVRVTELERYLAGLRRFWHYFHRRRVRQALHAASIQSLLAEQALTEARAERTALESEQPNFTGLSVDARRAINLAAVAYGQVLRERLTRSGLYEATHQASGRREPVPGEFGERDRCVRMMEEIQAARTQLEERRELLPEVRTRADAFRKFARYRGETDVAPDAASLAPDDSAASSLVLVEDCWEIYRVLLR
jgi:hypothetical protein